MESDNIKFQYYIGTVNDCKPKGIISLSGFLKSVKSPLDSTKKKIEKVREAKTKQDKNKIKRSLPSFTPAIIIKTWRNSKNIVKFNGLMPLDIDGLSATEIQSTKLMLSKIKSIIAVWTSPSGNGIRALVYIPICQSIDEYKLYYFGFIQSYPNFNFDNQLQSPVQLMFYSHDKDMIINQAPILWDKKRERPKPKFNISLTCQVEPSDITEHRVINYINKAFNGINDNGHPQMRNICLRLGNLIGAGWITKESAVQLAYVQIDSNPYLSTAHISTASYKKTALSAIEIGMLNPKGLENA